MLTVGELAQLAGTTVKAVRHYHAQGLLPEPARDHSGYRRYGSAALVKLLRIRRLRELGLSVPRIRELLGEGPATVRAALDELDRDLAARQREISKQRKKIAELRASTADLDLPEPVAGIFDRLALSEAGVSADMQDLEQSAVLLLHALAPEHTDRMAEFSRQVWLDQRELAQRVATRFQALTDAPADAPGVEELAEDMATLARAGEWHTVAGEPGHRHGAALLTDYLAGFSAAQRRAITLLGERLSAPGRAPG
ncbi:MerR family transcriptional regulator [Crossiella sp. CA198]|uniref:MerR family transcriptional regulator n=1 Tax=Crossiella sp. CA198 TaxID=3455607 RepID=UPI003F8D32F8